MKVEKISKNQVKFTLNKTDLSEHNVEITKLSYDSAKTQELFREMIEQAKLECDFHTKSNTHLIIEAIPVSQESLVIIITKTSKCAAILNKLNCMPKIESLFKQRQNNNLIIEKISDDQVKFILDKTYLSERNMKLADISYGSKKQQELLMEMLEQAKQECGFYTDSNTTLIIEAIPYLKERLIIIVKKNTKPIEINSDTTYNEKA